MNVSHCFIENFKIILLKPFKLWNKIYFARQYLLVKLCPSHPESGLMELPKQSCSHPHPTDTNFFYCSSTRHTCTLLIFKLKHRPGTSEFNEIEEFFYIFSVVLTTHFLSFSLPLFSFFLHGQFFCSRASGSTPTCPKRSVWSLPKVTRRSASPNNKQLQPLLTRL